MLEVNVLPDDDPAEVAGPVPGRAVQVGNGAGRADEDDADPRVVANDVVVHAVVARVPEHEAVVAVADKLVAGDHAIRLIGNPNTGLVIADSGVVHEAKSLGAGRVDPMMLERGNDAVPDRDSGHPMDGDAAIQIARIGSGHPVAGTVERDAVGLDQDAADMVLGQGGGRGDHQ